jgi:hypothetical protein
MKRFLSSNNKYRTNFLQHPDRLVIAIQLVTRRRKAFTIPIPSRRRIEFLQKNVTQSNVEFKDINVHDHRLNNKNCLLYAKRKAEYNNNVRGETTDKTANCQRTRGNTFEICCNWSNPFVRAFGFRDYKNFVI